MLFRTYVPADPLGQWVEHFWLVRAQDYPYEREWIFPEGTVDLMFNLGPSPHAVVEAESGATRSYRRAWVSGSRQRAILVETAAHGYDLVGIHFRPGGAMAFFDLPQIEISDQVIELDEVWGSVAEEIREQLALADAPDRLFAVVERVLLRRVRATTHADRLVEGAIREMRRAGPGTAVSDVARQLGVSHRRLIATFDRAVGLKPKVLQRVLRFQRVIQAEESRAVVDWAPLAIECGYFDQAHLIRDFRLFAGLTPEAYRAKRTEYPNSVLERDTAGSAY